jgi:hypothetical protein
MTQNLPDTFKSNSLQTSKWVTGGILLFIGIVGGLLTHFVFIFGIVAIIGFFLILTKLMVKKSLQLSNGPTDFPLTEIIQNHKHIVAQTKYFKGQEKMGEQSYLQIQELESQYKFLLSKLSEKFNPEEITFTRYEKSINEMVIILLDNFKYLANLLSLIDSKNEISDEEFQLLKSYQNANDSALIELRNLGKSLTNINVSDAINPTFEETLQRLKVLANQAQNYSTKNHKE